MISMINCRIGSERFSIALHEKWMKTATCANDEFAGEGITVGV